MPRHGVCAVINPEGSQFVGGFGLVFVAVVSGTECGVVVFVECLCDKL